MTISFLNENKLEYIDLVVENLNKYCKIKEISNIKFSNSASNDINIYVIYKKSGNILQNIIDFCKKNNTKVDAVLIAKFDGAKMNNINALSATKQHFKNVFTIGRAEILTNDFMVKKPFANFSIDMEKMFNTLIQK